MLQFKNNNNNMLCISNIFSFSFHLIDLKLDVIVAQYATRVCAGNIPGPCVCGMLRAPGCPFESINQNINFLNELLINQTATTTLIYFL